MTSSPLPPWWRARALAIAVTAAASVPAHAAGASPPPLPLLPSVARVRIEVAKERVLVIEEVSLPRGNWAGGDLDLYVAFGSPGVPRALDAHLIPLGDGALEALPTDVGEVVPIERASHRPAHAALLLGRPQMAGTVVHLKESALRRAFAPGKMAALRVRTLLPAPVEDAATGRELVVRLGIDAAAPLTLGRLQLVALEPETVQRAEAHLCGPDADPWPLALAVVPKPPADPHAPPTPGPIAPVLAVRHASDDLCIRYWPTR